MKSYVHVCDMCIWESVCVRVCDRMVRAKKDDNVKELLRKKKGNVVYKCRKDVQR